jgi:hypothetical protein
MGSVGRMVSHGHRNSGHIAPSAERRFASVPIIISRYAMTMALKVIVDPAVIGQETLRVTG